MKFLQLTRKFPYPPIDGESLNLSNFNRLLSEKGHQIDLLSFNTIKHYYKIENLPKEHNIYQNIFEVYLDNRIKVQDAFFNLFSSLPYHITRFIIKEFEIKLKEILIKDTYDFILVESLNLVPYIDLIKKYSKAKIIYRAHNVEYEIWERITENTKNLVKKAYSKYLTNKLKRYEIVHINDFDLLLTVTSRDLSKYKKEGFVGKSFVMPAGIGSKDYEPNPINNFKNIKLSFLGSLDWLPNIEGILWFIENSWQSILKSNPNAELHIAGRNTPKQIFDLQNNNIIVHGEIPDAKKYINSYPLMIVPLLSGGGMRLKILEALALGRIIVTTSVGLEGIDAQDSVEVLIADTPELFAKKIINCQNNPQLLQDLSKNARNLFQEKYNLSVSVDKLLNHLESI